MLSKAGIQDSRQHTKFQLAQTSLWLRTLKDILIAIPLETRVRIFRELVYNGMIAHSANHRGNGQSRSLLLGLGNGRKTRVQARMGMVSRVGLDGLAEADLKQPVEADILQDVGIWHILGICAIGFNERIHAFETSGNIVVCTCGIRTDISCDTGVWYVLCDVLQSAEDVGSNIVVGV
ncbi:hypothetical protein P691DRAFT_470338 [Macrolepiota fuliginosa MF-IS2]|uniref:Uncharacterized protein n=1 Tax=Macrolepiota fuliginosa MF-IS2 TaxID=1400762 RepID=A0A9P5X3J9_9AGAR|nr:hypothetical protein P691DRAFT_470338 [Macrolepiota fuliginosa MF-IS2]